MELRNYNIQKPSMVDRLIMAFLGGITGVIYAIIIYFLMARFLGHQFNSHDVYKFFIVFSAFGFFSGNIIIEALSWCLIFIFGIAFHYPNQINMPENASPFVPPRFRAILYLGMITGILLWHSHRFHV